MTFYVKPCEDELWHHGIKGQKWGVRRFQNEDGSLTEAGKKRYSKEFHNNLKKGHKQIDRQAERVYIKAYNNTANRMNNGEIARFNKEQKEKYGSEFAKREGYYEDYEKLFNSFFEKEYAQEVTTLAVNNQYIKRGLELVEKYNMVKWNQEAKDYINELNEFFEILGVKYDPNKK